MTPKAGHPLRELDVLLLGECNPFDEAEADKLRLARERLAQTPVERRTVVQTPYGPRPLAVLDDRPPPKPRAGSAAARGGDTSPAQVPDPARGDSENRS